MSQIISMEESDGKTIELIHVNIEDEEFDEPDFVNNSDIEYVEELSSDDSGDEPLSPIVKKARRGRKPKNDGASGSKMRYQYKFNKEWLQEFSWLGQSLKGDTFFYCIYCRKDFKCNNGGKSDVLKHTSSITHTRKMPEQDQNVSQSFTVVDKEKKKLYMQKFKKEWEQIPIVKAWISESVHGEYYFYCKFCKKDYRCSNGKTEIYKHMSAAKHQKNIIQPPSGKILKNHKLNFRGLLCPVFTPFHKNSEKDVNYGQINMYGNYLKLCGVKGILVNDVVGEGMSLTIEERKSILEAWNIFCIENDIFLMAQVGGAPLKNVIELASHAENLNVGAIVLLPDLYHRPKDHLDLIRYVKIVSDNIGSTPIFYHHHPKHTSLDLDMKKFLLDITGEVDTFMGIIYSSADLDDTLEVKELNPDKFIVFMDTDECILGAAVSGFTCIMSKAMNILPKLCKSIFTCMNNGEVNSARAAQDLLRKANFNIYNYGETIPALKSAMALISSIPMETVREPLQTVWDGNQYKMKEKLHSIGII